MVSQGNKMSHIHKLIISSVKKISTNYSMPFHLFKFIRSERPLFVQYAIIDP